MAVNLWDIGGKVAGGALSYWAGNRSAKQQQSAGNTMWDQARFQPYNISSGFGNTLFSGNNAKGALSPEYSGIAKRYRDLSSGFMSGLKGGNLNAMRDDQLGLLRQLSGPEETRNISDMQTMLFNKGLLGSTTGNLQMNSLFDAQSDADLKRQLSAMQLAQNERGSLFDLSTRATNQDLEMQGLPLQQIALGGQLGVAQSGANSTAGKGQYDAALNKSDGEAMFWQNLIGKGMDFMGDFGDASTAMNAGKEMGNLFNAGGGNPFSAASQIGKETMSGSGGWGDLGSGPRTTVKMPTSSMWGTSAELAAGTSALLGAETGLFASGAGSQAAMLAAQNLGLNGATALTTEALAANMAAQGGTVAGGTAAGWGAGTAFGVAAAMIPVLKAISGSGTTESEKLGKLLGSSSQEAEANVSKLLAGKLWTFKGRPELGNAGLIAMLVKKGAVQPNDPRLQSYLKKWGDYTGPRAYSKFEKGRSPSLNQLLGIK